jgi:hypothetical protein
MDAERRIDELERRLERYHEQLETAIEQRDRFVLQATWGVVKGVIIGGVFIGAISATEHWFPNLSWLATAGITILATILAIIFAGLIGLYLERMEEDDASKFWRLPRWGPDKR